MHIIYPVIMAVPASVKTRPRRDRVTALSALARQALQVSADRQRIGLGPLLKNSAGAPQPCNGRHWSLSHKPDYVAGVVAAAAIGLDVERIRPVHAGLHNRIAAAAEWELFAEVSPVNFFRVWTAKEAVLKAAGVGLRGLALCRLQRSISHVTLELGYHGRRFEVEHCYFDDHVAAVVKTGSAIEWVFAEANFFLPLDSIIHHNSDE